MSSSKKFEILIGKLYERKGYKVELNKVLKGRSGALHEFDGYCTKKGKELVFEAKYISRPVSLDDFSRFLTAVDDCKIEEAHLITNSYFSENVLNLASTYKIKLFDGEKLKAELKKYGLEGFIRRDTLFSLLAKIIVGYFDKKAFSKIFDEKILFLDLENLTT